MKSSFTVVFFSSEETMEILRQRLLENATNQSDLLEIFSAIDRGLILLTKKKFY
jgi:hypothetical protein